MTLDERMPVSNCASYASVSEPGQKCQKYKHTNHTIYLTYINYIRPHTSFAALIVFNPSHGWCFN